MTYPVVAGLVESHVVDEANTGIDHPLYNAGNTIGPDGSLLSDAMPLGAEALQEQSM